MLRANRVRVIAQTGAVLDATVTTDWIIAVATVPAALGAAAAAIFAARAASSAGRSATIAQQELQASARPLLLDVPYEHYADHEHEMPWPGETMRKTPMRGQIVIDASYGTFALPVRNVGRGAARVEGITFTLTAVGVTHVEPGGIVIPVGEDRWLAGKPNRQEFRDALARVPSPVHGAIPYGFVITYTDITGTQKQQLELGIGTVGQDSAQRVKHIAHRSC